MNAHYDTANVLLEEGADPNIVDKAGMAALYAAVDMSSLGEVYGMPPRKVQDTLKPTDLISRLIAKGAVVDARLKSRDAAAESHAGRAAARCRHDAADARGAEMVTTPRCGSCSQPVRIRTLKQPRRDDGSDDGRRARVAGLASSPRTSAPRRICAGRRAARRAQRRRQRVNRRWHHGDSPGGAGRLDSVVTVLAKHGARLDVKDKRGRTPVDMAMGVGGRGRAGGPPPVYERTAKLLKELGAP